MTNLTSQYRWYMIGVVTFVIPMGIQMVLFPWLIAVELQLDAAQLGFAQMTLQIPPLLLLLFGGVLADRIDARWIVAGAHGVACLPPLGLAALILLGELSYGWLLVYAALMGAVIAFVNPARDSLLNRVAESNLQRGVTVAMGLTFGAQIVGFAIASVADTSGAPILLLGQALILATGIFATFRLQPVTQFVRENRHPLREIRDGLGVVLASSNMRASIILLFAMGMFFGGSFIVLNPLVVRDVYSGSAQEISLSFTAFMSGTICTAIALVASGGLTNPGRGLVQAVVAGSVVLSMAVLVLPFWGYLVVLFGWGICGGVAMSMGRTIMQTWAPEEYRARVMSVFSLANMGGIPFGAVLMGFCAAHLGPLNSYLVAVSGICITALIVVLNTDIARKSEPGS